MQSLPTPHRSLERMLKAWGVAGKLPLEWVAPHEVGAKGKTFPRKGSTGQNQSTGRERLQACRREKRHAINRPSICPIGVYDCMV